jgi:type II secretion system protein H
MPTSATGRSSSSRRQAAGFTLFELMVALAIIGVMLVVAGLAVPDAARDRLTLEADRLVRTLEDCRRGAVLSATPRGVEAAGDRYRLLQYRGQWVAGEAREAEHVLAETMHIEVQRALGDLPPDVICLPTGETVMRPLRLSLQASSGFYEIDHDEAGDIVATWFEPNS